MSSGRLAVLALVVLTLALPLCPAAGAQDAASPASPRLADAERLYYSGDYPASAEMAKAIRQADPANVAASELRTSALHFQIKRLLGDAKDREKALKACGACPALLAAFAEETSRGTAAARAHLVTSPRDIEMTFLLGKLLLNHVWLQLGTLGHRTAWGEYREARRLIEQVLHQQPTHVRARVAHAWIEYIVDTRVPFLFKWALGGGDRKKALAEMRLAAEADAPFMIRTEARFARWEMLTRDKRIAEALGPARLLVQDFPANRELAAFLEKHGAPAR